jgi:hypothetical protein
VKTAHTNQITDFAKFTEVYKTWKLSTKQKVPINNEIIEEEDYLKHTPIIPQSVYGQFTTILFESCQTFKEKRKDTFLTGALAILSGCLPMFSGLYSGDVVHQVYFLSY